MKGRDRVLRVSQWGSRLGRFVKDQSGPTTTEYAVMFALILLVCVATIGQLGMTVSAAFAEASQGW